MSEEALLLAALVRRDAGALERLARLDISGWQQVLVRVRQHRCLPYLTWLMEQAGVAPPVRPDPAVRRRWKLRALSLHGECVRLSSLLSDAGIAHLFLKGVPLAMATYPEPWLRPLRDIDLLVAPADLDRAQEILLQHGGPMERYAHKTGTPADDDAKHLVPVWSPGRLFAVELHGHASDSGSGLGPEARDRLDAALWQGAVDLECEGGHLPVPGPEVLFVHLVLHGVYDHELNNGPLFVIDLQHLLDRMPLDPERVVALAVDLGMTRGVALALSLLPRATTRRDALVEVLRIVDGAGALPVLPEDTAAALLLQDGTLRTEVRLSADLAAQGKLDQMRLLRGKVFASRETMIDRWRMEGHEGSPPVSNIAFWLWFVVVRLRGMRRASGQALAGRDHLMRLRALRDGREG